MKFGKRGGPRNWRIQKGNIVSWIFGSRKGTGTVTDITLKKDSWEPESFEIRDTETGNLMTLDNRYIARREKA